MTADEKGQRLVPKRKREAVANLVRTMIKDGTLKPGGAVPSGAALAREAGCCRTTGRAALQSLLADGTLMPGASPAARLRVAQPDGARAQDAETLRAALSSTLAVRRRAAGMTQPQLAAKIGMSVTSLAHAETGRVWQSRRFWMLADQALGSAGDLLRMYDMRAAAVSARPGEDITAGLPAAAGLVLPVSATISAAGVVVLWPDGSKTVAPPPALVAGKDDGSGPGRRAESPAR